MAQMNGLKGICNTMLVNNCSELEKQWSSILGECIVGLKKPIAFSIIIEQQVMTSSLQNRWIIKCPFNRYYWGWYWVLAGFRQA